MSRVVTYEVPFLGGDLKPAKRHHQLDKHSRIFSYVLAILAFILILLCAGAVVYTRAYHSVAPINQEAVTKSTSTLVSNSSFADTIQKIENQNVTLVIGGSNVVVPKQDIQKWIITTPAEDSNQKITINTPGLQNYFDQLSRRYLIKPSDQIVVVYSNGDTEVMVPGSNGFVLGDTTAAQSQIEAQLALGQGMNIELPGSTVPFKTSTTAQAAKYIEVDITKKRLYAYENNILVKTFLVTAGANATPTPTGTYSIWQKLLSQDMRGLNADGSEYYQPSVSWVSYFDHRGDAIHGNYWRPASVFGNVNTSHGCVGLTNADAKWIYNWAPIGTRVTIHR